MFGLAIPGWLSGSIKAAALITVLFLVWDYKNTAEERSEAVAELKKANDDIERLEEAQRVHRAHLKRQEADRQQYDQILSELQSMEGRDAPLSPLLRAASERLFGQ